MDGWWRGINDQSCAARISNNSRRKGWVYVCGGGDPLGRVKEIKNILHSWSFLFDSQWQEYLITRISNLLYPLVMLLMLILVFCKNRSALRRTQITRVDCVFLLARRCTMYHRISVESVILFPGSHSDKDKTGLSQFCLFHIKCAPVCFIAIYYWT